MGKWYEDNFPDEECLPIPPDAALALSSVYRELAAYTGVTGNEAMVAVDSASGAVLAFSEGDPSSVSLPARHAGTLSSRPDRSVILVHTHPHGCDGMSEHDVVAMDGLRWLLCSVVVCMSGEIDYAIPA